jgi:hypothetical protein
MTTTIDRPVEDAYCPEEGANVNASLRRQLGLRPLYYSEDGRRTLTSVPARPGAGSGRNTESTSTRSTRRTPPVEGADSTLALPRVWVPAVQ